MLCCITILVSSFLLLLRIIIISTFDEHTDHSSSTTYTQAPRISTAHALEIIIITINAPCYVAYMWVSVLSSESEKRRVVVLNVLFVYAMFCERGYTIWSSFRCCASIYIKLGRTVQILSI